MHLTLLTTGLLATLSSAAPIFPLLKPASTPTTPPFTISTLATHPASPAIPIHTPHRSTLLNIHHPAPANISSTSTSTSTHSPHPQPRDLKPANFKFQDWFYCLLSILPHCTGSPSNGNHAGYADKPVVEEDPNFLDPWAPVPKPPPPPSPPSVPDPGYRLPWDPVPAPPTA